MKTEPPNSIDDLLAMVSKINSGFIWVMSEENLHKIRWTYRGYQDDTGNSAYEAPRLSGYGKLLGHMIAIVPFQYFGIARI